MKNLILIFIFFVSVIFCSAQQCLSGGCSNFVKEYPSVSAPYLFNSSWEILQNPQSGNDALLNAGNYTLFSVEQGNTYEWTYCEDYGGLSNSWDSQLTLFNNSDLSNPICFSTDQCGKNNLGAYLSWESSFSGVVRVLTSEYKNTGCRSNTSSPYNKLAFRKISDSQSNDLNIIVKNVNDAKIQDATVKLYDENWNLLQTKYTNSSGQVNFSNLNNANYNYEIYYTPSETNPPINEIEEFWGNSLININGNSPSVTFTRIQPFISSIGNFSPNNLTVGHLSTTIFTIQNNLPYPKDSYIKVWIDIDKQSNWDIIKSTETNEIKEYDDLDYPLSINPSKDGTYNMYAMLYTFVNNKFIVTDQYSWTEVFTVGALNSAYGIDVSHYQGNINWQQVYNSGKTFAFIKSTEGYTFDDPKYNYNITNGKNAGIQVGAYHVARPDNNTAIDEANHFVTIAGNQIGSGYLPPALDLEPSYVELLTPSALSSWVYAWLNEVYRLTGVHAIIYTTHYDANNWLSTSLNSYKLWIANYETDPTTEPSNLGIWSDWTFNQYSATGIVSGINTAVDLDIYNGSASQLDIVGVTKLTNEINDYSIFPNPNNGSFTVKFNNNLKNGKIIIRNSISQIVYEQNIDSQEKNIELNLATGFYYVQVLNTLKHINSTTKIVVHREN